MVVMLQDVSRALSYHTLCPVSVTRVSLYNKINITFIHPLKENLFIGRLEGFFPSGATLPKR
jgi:hypothetical protein